ncbi:MAG: hypothetical protein OXF20_13735 [Gammaproteobacteria bacterium]|nr:hypothetical protein [Gammaproteobacteria bacterium]
MKPKRTVTLPHSSYQPKKAELQERIKIDVPGKSVEEKMTALADALMQPVNIQYQDRQ